MKDSLCCGAIDFGQRFGERLLDAFLVFRVEGRGGFLDVVFIFDRIATLRLRLRSFVMSRALAEAPQGRSSLSAGRAFSVISCTSRGK